MRDVTAKIRIRGVSKTYKTDGEEMRALARAPTSTWAKASSSRSTAPSSGRRCRSAARAAV